MAPRAPRCVVRDEQFAVPGSKRPTNNVICGAGGNLKICEEVDNIIPFNFNRGGV